LGIDALQEDERFAEAEPVLTMMRRNVNLQSRLLNDLSDFTTIGQHKLRLHLAEMDVQEIVQFVQVICRTDLRQRAKPVHQLIRLGHDRDCGLAETSAGPVESPEECDQVLEPRKHHRDHDDQRLGRLRP
jgi:hypothetical protein